MNYQRFALIGAIAIVLPFLAASAQTTPISGNLSDSTTGPLTPGTIYRVVGSVNVPAGQTLTVQAGVVIKMNFDQSFSVGGTLNVNGTAGAPVTITTDNDDSIGGDTNANGPSAGSADYWRNLTLNGGSVANLNYLTLRYAGRFSSPGILSSGATLTMSNCTIANCSSAGFSMNSTPAAVTVTNNTLTGNGLAMNGIPLQSLAGFSGNACTGNGGADSVLVTNGTIATNATVPAACMVNGCIVLDAAITVNAGATLTLGSGLVMKIRMLDLIFSVNGVLNVQGTSGQPVVLTTISDDSFGGDTNEDGLSAVGADYWRGINFAPTAAPSTLNFLRLRGGGRFSNGLLRSQGSRINASNCTIDNSSSAALDMTNTLPAVGTTFSACAFNQSVTAVANVPISAVPMFLNCTASGNAGFETMSVTTSAVVGSVTIASQNMIGGVIHMVSGITIPAGATLTLLPGVVCKMALDAFFTVNGVLNTVASSGSPAVVTSIVDDTYGGDTNENGSSTAGGDYWRSVFINAGSGPSTITGLIIRDAGRFGSAGMTMGGGNVVANDCIIERCSNAAVGLNSVTTAFSFTNCNFRLNALAVSGATLNALANFSNCVASGNSQLNTIDVTGTAVSGTAVVSSANMINGCVRISSNISVPVGTTLQLNADVVFKMTLDRIVTIDGTFNTQSAANQPVVFTDINDDSIGGDTNLNGPSSVSPDYWRGVTMTASSGGSSLEGLKIRGAGRFSTPALDVRSNAVILGCGIESCSSAGLSFAGTTVSPIIEDLTVNSCGGIAVDGCTWASFENIKVVNAAQNGGNYARMVSDAGTTDADVFAHSLPNGVLYTNGSRTIPAGGVLRLHRGVVMKMSLDAIITVQGTLELLGTGLQPVVLTTFADDDFGGNSEGTPGTTAVADYWRTIAYAAGAGASRVEHVLVRGAGRFGFTAFSNASPLMTIDALRVERSSAVGIDLSALGDHARNVVVTSCGSPALRLSGGSFDVLHATVTQNAAIGIDAGAGWSGEVRNSISWGHTTSNFQGFTAANLFNSNGSPTLTGTNGNINANPLFVNATAGDLSLGVSSPCCGVADFVTASLLLTDHDDAARRLDHNFTGFANPDLGAYETGPYHLDVQGEPRLEATQTYTITGSTPGLGVLFAGIGVTTGYADPYGDLLAGDPNSILILAFLPTGQPFSVVIPSLPAIIGFPFKIQGLAVLPTNTTRGGVTEVYRGVVF